MKVTDVSAMAGSQAVKGAAEGRASQDDGGSANGWKFVTVQEGDVLCTYIVIGKNMRVLVGTAPVREQGKDKKTATGGGQEAADSQGQTAAGTGQSGDGRKPAEEAVSFLTDKRMLGLTGHHQKKMRETLRKLEEHVTGRAAASADEEDIARQAAAAASAAKDSRDRTAAGK